jgi:hypothetical protein
VSQSLAAELIENEHQDVSEPEQAV